jgi:hypothetical protein
VRPGATLEDVHEAAVETLVDGLLSLGLLEGSAAQVISDGQYRRFYMHRTSHWLGMDVHDAGDYAVNGRPRPLEAEMVLTVEPGLYFAADLEGVPDAYRGIGVRIEDDVIVTPDGGEILSVGVPRTADGCSLTAAARRRRPSASPARSTSPTRVRTPQPTAPRGAYGRALSLYATDAMSRCAQGTPETNSRRKSPPKIDPAVPSPVFFRSAIGLFIASAYSSTRGSSQTGSPERRATSITSWTSFRSLPITAASPRPSLVTAPVGRQIEDPVRSPGGGSARRVGERVGEDEPPFGVGVEDFDGLAAVGPEHVTRPVGVPTGHVLRGRHVPPHLDRGRDPADRAHRAEDGGPAGHVSLLDLHAAGGLERETTRVEADPLSDERDDRWRGHAARAVDQLDEPRRVAAAAADREDRAHAGAAQLRRAEAAHPERASPAELLGLPSETRRRDLLGGSIREIASEARRLGHGDRMVLGARGVLRCRPADDGHELDSRSGARRLEVVHPVVRQRSALDHGSERAHRVRARRRGDRDGELANALRIRGRDGAACEATPRLRFGKARSISRSDADDRDQIRGKVSVRLVHVHVTFARGVGAARAKLAEETAVGRPIDLGDLPVIARPPFERYCQQPTARQPAAAHPPNSHPDAPLPSRSLTRSARIAVQISKDDGPLARVERSQAASAPQLVHPIHLDAPHRGRHHTGLDRRMAEAALPDVYSGLGRVALGERSRARRRHPERDRHPPSATRARRRLSTAHDPSSLVPVASQPKLQSHRALSVIAFSYGAREPSVTSS